MAVGVSQQVFTTNKWSHVFPLSSAHQTSHKLIGHLKGDEQTMWVECWLSQSAVIIGMQNRRPGESPPPGRRLAAIFINLYRINRWWTWTSPGDLSVLSVNCAGGSRGGNWVQPQPGERRGEGHELNVGKLESLSVSCGGGNVKYPLADHHSFLVSSLNWWGSLQCTDKRRGGGGLTHFMSRCLPGRNENPAHQKEELDNTAAAAGCFKWALSLWVSVALTGRLKLSSLDQSSAEVLITEHHCLDTGHGLIPVLLSLTCYMWKIPAQHLLHYRLWSSRETGEVKSSRCGQLE